MKQYEAVIQTMERLGGIATLAQLNVEVFKIKDCKWGTKTPFASIRRIVQDQDGKSLYKIKPGLYALTSKRKQFKESGIVAETVKNENSIEVQSFNHTYYQSLLLTVGKLKNFKTFVPNQDKNKRIGNITLGELGTLSEIPKFSQENIIKRSSTVDVIWFNERNMPHSFFEVEFSTDIQNSLLKFNDLFDFSARMVIVADGKRYDEYNKKLNYSSFKNLVEHNRVKFLTYETLQKQYDYEVEKQGFEFIL